MSIELFLKTHRQPVLSDDDRHALEGAAAQTVTFAPRQVIVREMTPLTQCTLLMDGLIQRYKDTPDGRRQILAIHIPGDFVDLHSYPLKKLEHSVSAITAVTCLTFPHTAIRALTERSATLTEILWRSTMIDAAINREWIVSVGARAAAVRIAHLLCEMYLRFERVGMAGDCTYTLPITQIDLAEATGLTPVHANRMLRQLREAGLVEFRNDVVTILDWKRLQRFAEFDPTYLFFD